MEGGGRSGAEEAAAEALPQHHQSHGLRGLREVQAVGQAPDSGCVHAPTKRAMPCLFSRNAPCRDDEKYEMAHDSVQRQQLNGLQSTISCICRTLPLIRRIERIADMLIKVHQVGLRKARQASHCRCKPSLSFTCRLRYCLLNAAQASRHL